MSQVFGRAGNVIFPLADPPIWHTCLRLRYRQAAFRGELVSGRLPDRGGRADDKRRGG